MALPTLPMHGGPPTSNLLLPAKTYLLNVSHSPNSATCWALNVKTQRPVGDTSHSKHNRCQTPEKKEATRSTRPSVEESGGSGEAVLRQTDVHVMWWEPNLRVSANFPR